ncbi:hypothetical protein, partial [Acinetobacter baumannii]|uniref:hypothetical protein n=1 Tax=Acinetobacter baumannii TaxID=470 RepID=UPI000A45C805
HGLPNPHPAVRQQGSGTRPQGRGQAFLLPRAVSVPCPILRPQAASGWLPRFLEAESGACPFFEQAPSRWWTCIQARK